MFTIDNLPTLNALINGTTVILLLCGFIAVKREKTDIHRAFMIAALVASALFLVSYLTYHFNRPPTPYEGEGLGKIFYYFILIPHVLLAMALVPMAIITATRALRGNRKAHRRIARKTLPLWFVVSGSGVVVYLMLYVF